MSAEHSTARGCDIQIADAAMAPVIAALHQASFARGWSDAEVASLLGAPGVTATLAVVAAKPAGFLMLRQAGGEAEIIAIAVAPPQRRRGLGRALLLDSLERAVREGIETVFLEVSEDNDAALACYRQAGFAAAGRRHGYYREGRARPADALLLRLDLDGAGALNR